MRAALAWSSGCWSVRVLYWRTLRPDRMGAEPRCGHRDVRTRGRRPRRGAGGGQRSRATYPETSVSQPQQVKPDFGVTSQLWSCDRQQLEDRLQHRTATRTTSPSHSPRVGSSEAAYSAPEAERAHGRSSAERRRHTVMAWTCPPGSAYVRTPSPVIGARRHLHALHGLPLNRCRGTRGPMASILVTRIMEAPIDHRIYQSSTFVRRSRRRFGCRGDRLGARVRGACSALKDYRPDAIHTPLGLSHTGSGVYASLHPPSSST
ncbi:hypothetical protein SAMN04488563_5445 [Jiangella alkaliphila]|uniref:Uncharacterized protein n=1 Tax=Jiangella alkaliphila TaxID=419479 RepID=A0A1H2L8Y6_9ACTN|nr:hypothetical protein SAMN04488563_5445 [Jiangella alkaliphila]